MHNHQMGKISLERRDYSNLLCLYADVRNWDNGEE